MKKLKDIFKIIKNDLHALIPPLTEVIDEEHHYEVVAKYNEHTKFFASVIMHEDYIEFSLFDEISREEAWLLFPGDLFKRMENSFKCEIKDLSPELEGDIKEALSNLIDYFRLHKLLGPQKEF